MPRFIFLLAAVLLLTPTGTSAQSRQVKGSEFVTIMSGNTLLATNKAGVKFKAWFLSGGNATYEDEKGARDQGSWRIKEDEQVCVTWKKIGEARERCARVYVEANELVWRGDGVSGDGKLLGGVR